VTGEKLVDANAFINPSIAETKGHVFLFFFLKEFTADLFQNNQPMQPSEQFRSQFYPSLGAILPFRVSATTWSPKISW